MVDTALEFLPQVTQKYLTNGNPLVVASVIATSSKSNLYFTYVSLFTYISYMLHLYDLATEG